MKHFISYSVTLVGLVCICLGCDYLEADDECCPVVDAIEKCSELNDKLELCDPNADMNVPGCHVKQNCDEDGENCEKVCDGDPVPCETLSNDVCSAAINCEWWNDPDNIDRDIE